MALRDPRLGDPRIIILRDTIVAYIRAAFAVTALKTVDKYRGVITAEVLRQYSVKAPAVIVAIEGTDTTSSTGSSVQLPVLFDAAIITKFRTDGDEDDACAAISEKLTRLLTDNSFELDWADAAQGCEARNIYTGKIGNLDVNIWRLKWSQSIKTDRMTSAEFHSLPDLETIHSTYEPTEGAPDHQHRTTIDHP